jgi:predicted deacylase
MAATTPLAASYAEARARFLSAASGAGATVTSHDHHLTGPDNEPLAIDVAELGPADADDAVLVVSGTHGVEGYAGSALQSQWLATAADARPGHVRLVMVHALNPYGFAWVQRVNEDNVDLNRNFIDWDQPPPANPEYDVLIDDLVPDSWDEQTQQRTAASLLGHMDAMGFDHAKSVISRGQYTHPNGVFYGGTGPTWSNRWLRSWSATHLSGCRRVAVIDLHTGLGPWGHGEFIVHLGSNEPGYRRAAQMWGDVKSPVDGDTVSSALNGDWLDAFDHMVPSVEVTSTCLEFGTVDPITVLQSLRADAWLHAHGDPTGPDAPGIRAMVRAAFADDDPAWVATLWQQFEPALAAALQRP